MDIVDKYLIGRYDLEILCLPRLYIKNIEINQSTTTQIKVPAPGTAIIQKNKLGNGSLYVMRDKKMEWIYNLRDEDIQESILLQPGTYMIVFRGKEAKYTKQTVSKTFTIRSNMTSTVTLPK